MNAVRSQLLVHDLGLLRRLLQVDIRQNGIHTSIYFSFEFTGIIQHKQKLRRLSTYSQWGRQQTLRWRYGADTPQLTLMMLPAAVAAAAAAALYTSSSYYCVRTRAVVSAASRDQTEHPSHAPHAHATNKTRSLPRNNCVLPANTGQYIRRLYIRSESVQNVTVVLMMHTTPDLKELRS